jgi:hypothetical protein
MSDDQPNFKVTDRRLFNADGSPRDLPPEEKPEPTPVPKPVEQPVASETSHASAGAAAGTQTQTETSAMPEAADELGEEFSPEELDEVRDPAGFVNFIMSIASNAASALGMMEHPVTHQREVDVELGKHWIDILGMLEKKTAGNLNAREKQMLEGLLSDLRMQYVSLVNAPPQARRYSGSDITGGR